MINIGYEASPTCAAFMKSNAFGRLIAGPVGSGKTVSCVFELFRRALEQEQAPNGVRYTRYAVVRQTLKQLKDTVLKDITSWLEGVASYKVSDNTIYIEVGDVYSEWMLIPLEDPEDQRRLLSMQLTAAWMSEAIEMDIDLIAAISGRIPRYPSAARGNPSWHGIIADTNFPTEASEWHKFMEAVRAGTIPDWQVFLQPGGLEPGAENLAHLNQTADTKHMAVDDPARLAQGRKYYERLARNPNQDWVKRYVHAQYGNDPSGTAVFRESFKHSFHVVPTLESVIGHPLLVGQDFGRDPWAIICQIDHKGRLLVLQEVGAEDIGLELHVQRGLRPALMDPRYIGRPVCVIGDPAGVAKGNIFEESSFDALKRMGFPAYPAPTNDLDPRLRAVDAFLLAQRDGGPAMIIDGSRCPNLVRALGGGYRYGKTKAGQRKPLPDKNQDSHVVDSLQYVCLVAHGGMGEMVARHIGRKKKAAKPRMSAAAWT